MKFKIGEFSKYNRVTVKTLRYYEEIGLLSPSETDEWTGYRYYSVDQLGRMAAIRRLKLCGFSLDEIREILGRGLTEADCLRKLEELSVLKEELDRRIEWLSEGLKTAKGETKMKECIIKTLPEVTIAGFRTKLDSYADLMHLMPEVFGPEMERLGCECAEPDYCFNIYYDGEYRERDIDAELCQAVKEAKTDSELVKFRTLPEVPLAVCVRHKGPYETLGESYAAAFRYAEELGLEPADLPRESYLDGIWNKEDPEDWLTEIQIPVRRPAR